METDVMIKNGVHALVLIGLVFVLLFLLTFTGVMKCRQLPLLGEPWCDVYWTIKTYTTGAPRVLIVYGDSGLGNPTGFGTGSLEEILAEPQILGVHSDTLHVDRVSFGTLRNYDIVIVEKAKMIETKQLRAFIEYATQPTGGVLVWTGDAGTQLGPNDHLLYSEDKNPELEDGNHAIGPWARRDGDLMVLFDELLGVRPIDNEKVTFCELVACQENKPINAGNIETEPTASHPLIKGMSDKLVLYVFKNQDFAVVETVSGTLTNEVLSLDFGTEMDSAGKDINRSVPMIVASGVGERVLYYAMPPELYANPRLGEFEKGRYFLPTENLYYGIIKG
jgi:hypothetical protein